ncbi:hypothetical protein BH23BAC4_BH23BAC4_12680 [soil metagenome]
MTLAKRFTVAAFGLLALVLLFPQAQAQDNRLGYLDPDMIIIRMPEYRTIQQQLATRQREISTELTGLQNRFEERLQQYQEQAQILSEEARNEREQELLGIQQQIQERQRGGMNELGQREGELMQPLLNQLQEVIDTVATEQNLALVIATRANNAPVLLFASDRAVDLTLAVMARLNIDPDATPPAAVLDN